MLKWIKATHRAMRRAADKLVADMVAPFLKQ